MQKLEIHNKHWHHVYRRRRRRVLATSPKQIAIGQLISLSGAVLAGYHLDNNKTSLALIVGTFLVLPGILDLNGSLGGALSAKINHHMEEKQIKVSRLVLHSVGFALLIALLAGLILGVIGGAIAVKFFGGDFWDVIQLCLGAVMLSALLGFPIVALLTVILRKVGVNPDDVMGPIETSFFDFLTVITLVIVVGHLS